MKEDATPAEISRTLSLPKRNRVLIIFCILSALFGVLGLSLSLYTWDRGLIAKGVVLEIPLGQLSMDEAKQKLDNYREEIYQYPFKFISDDKSIVIDMKELGFTCTYDEALQEAYRIGREGTVFNRAISKYKAGWGIDFKPEYQWNDHVLTEALTKHLSFLNIPAVDAHFFINPDNSMEIVPERLGKQIDFDSLKASITMESLKDLKIISVPYKPVKPMVTKTDLESVLMNGILSEYTTSFDQNLQERTHNIKLAAKAMDGLLLKPGEVFSFNLAVGPRTADAGYQEAIIIEGNRFVPGLGGGVCQVSSTLYNAVQLAAPSLSVIERNRHSLPVKYVPPGQDATVVYPDLDFKFRNTTEGYLLIRSHVKGNTLKFSLYGKSV